MEKVIRILTLVLLSSCHLTDYQEGPILSPDHNLELRAFVNRTNNSKPNFAKVVLTVNDRTSEQSAELVTEIGDVMKWAIDWYDNNIIIAQSSDIGTRSWRYLNGNFKELTVTPEMHKFAEQLRIEKYQPEK